MSIDLRALVSRIDVSRLTPRMTIGVTDMQTMHGEMKQCVEIIIHVLDAETTDNEEIELFQECEIPEHLLAGDDEVAVVECIFDWARRVLEHELEECFKFDGKRPRHPRHPL